jgi:hypothetical protein
MGYRPEMSQAKIALGERAIERSASSQSRSALPDRAVGVSV